jgi:hypothetical protein
MTKDHLPQLDCLKITILVSILKKLKNNRKYTFEQPIRLLVHADDCKLTPELGDTSMAFLHVEK